MKIDLSYTPSPQNEEVFAQWQADDALRAMPYIKADYLDDLAKTRPSVAANECARAVMLLGMGSQPLLRRYIASTYYTAFYLKQNSHALARFADDYALHGLAKKADIDKTKSQLLERVFYFVFRNSGHTKNRVYSYAYGLQHHFCNGVEPELVKEDIVSRGSEVLYRDALVRNKLRKAKIEYEASGRNISEPFDENYLKELPEIPASSPAILNNTGLYVRTSPSSDNERQMTDTVETNKSIADYGFDGRPPFEPHPRQLPEIDEPDDSDEEDDYDVLYEMVKDLQKELNTMKARVEILEAQPMVSKKSRIE